MSTSLDVWAGAVLPHYKFRILSHSQPPNRQNEWIFDSDQGKKRVRIYSNESDFLNDVVVSEYIAKHGYRRLPRLIRTKYGDPGISFDQAWYGFTDEIEGRALEFTPEDVLPFIRNMALLHQAIKGLPLQESSSAPKTWREMMLTSVQDIKKSYEAWGRNPTNDPIEKHFLQHSDWYSNHIRKVEQAFAEEQSPTDFRCLGNAGLEDCILSPNGRVYFITIPKPYADTPIYDVARFCLHALDQEYPDAIPDILQEYRTIANMTEQEQEQEQIKTYLLFPHSNWKLFYLYRRKRGTPEQLATLMEQEQGKNQKREAWIHSMFPVSK